MTLAVMYAIQGLWPAKCGENIREPPARGWRIHDRRRHVCDPSCPHISGYATGAQRGGRF